MGCPAKTGRPWTLREMKVGTAKEPYVSVLQLDALAQLQKEVVKKKVNDAEWVVLWDDLNKIHLPS